MSIGDGLALIAVVIAFVSLYRTRKQTEMENKLNENASKLSELQLTILERQEKENSSADVSAYFYLDNTSNCRVVVCNKGKASAHNVTFDLRVSGEERSPLLHDGLSSKFPVDTLSPGDEIYLIAALTIDMPPVFDAVITWNNPDGTPNTKELKMSLSE